MSKQATNGNANSRGKQAALDLLNPRNGGSAVRPVEFHEVFAANYGLYGLHVVQERALPDARDGLKPVQRRILYTMYEGRYLASGSHRKSAEIVGKVLGDRHPHGDASVYDAMARMAQPFSLRYPLIDGQGNWGASDGSPAAAYRYTEAKLTRLAEALLSDDLAKQTVPMELTYKEDPKVLEPRYLPGHIPPVVNSIDGIAVGISTTVPPHNLGESLRACLAMLDAGVLNEITDSKNNPTQEASWLEQTAHAQAKFPITELLKYLPGPDYPEGGQVLAGRGGVREYLESGRGRFVIRGSLVMEQLTPTKKALVITALPPVGRDRIIDSIINAINERKLEGLVAEPPLDETNEERTRIVLELKRDARPDQVLENLYKYTLLEVAVSVQLYFLFANRAGNEASVPRQVGMVELLAYWLHHQLDVLERRLAFELAQYKTRLNVVEALLIGATHAQAIVKIFQEADGKAAAKAIIQTKYKLSDEQAEVIASMSLSQVTRPDSGRYLAEKAELVGKVASHQELLASRPKRINLLKQELKETEKKFGDIRRTLIDQTVQLTIANAATAGTSENGTKAAIVTPTPQALHEALALALYADGSIKATPRDAFGFKARTVKSDENIVKLTGIAPDEFVLAATNAGRVFGLPLERLDITTRAGRAESIARHLKLEVGEQVINLLPVSGRAFNTQNEDDNKAKLYLVEFSALGKVKKTVVSEYKTANSTGLGSLKLANGETDDKVVAAVLSDGQGEYFVTTDNGQTLRFLDEKLSVQGRVGQGQAAIDLAKGARVVNAEFYNANSAGKATGQNGQASLDLLSQPVHKVVKAVPTVSASKDAAVQFSLLGFESKANNQPDIEEVATNKTSVPPTTPAYLLLLTKKGIIKKTPLEEYPVKGRATGGVASLMFSSPDDKVVTTRIITDEENPPVILVNTGSGSVIIETGNLPILARAKKGQVVPEYKANVGTNGVARIVPLAVAE